MQQIAVDKRAKVPRDDPLATLEVAIRLGRAEMPDCSIDGKPSQGANRPVITMGSVYPGD
jgi:hypothetical protein